MKLAKISLILYIAMKLIYGYWGDYFEEVYYWSASYYVISYLMCAFIVRGLYLYSLTVSDRYLFGLAFVYFMAITIVYVVILFKIEWYEILITQRKKVTAGQGIFVGGLAVINFLRIKRYLIINHFREKSHDPKNQRKVD